MYSLSALSAKEDMMGASCKPKYDDAVSQSSSTEDDLRKEQKKKTKSRGKVERKKKHCKVDLSSSSESTSFSSQSSSSPAPRKSSKNKDKAKKRNVNKKQKCTRGMYFKSPYSNLCVQLPIQYIYVSFYLFVYLATHCNEIGQADTFLD